MNLWRLILSLYRAVDLSSRPCQKPTVLPEEVEPGQRHIGLTAEGGHYQPQDSIGKGHQAAAILEVYIVHLHGPRTAR